MSWLVALAAFAGIMAVFSTVVTVGIELVHKLFSMRRSGLEEMLRALYQNVIVDIETEPPANAKETRKRSAQFANSVTASPSFGGKGRWWWPANWPLLRVSQRRFEHLSRRQLVEQIAQTEFGESLLGKDREYVKRVLARTAYQFDRYGAAQSDFFRRRAKVMAGLTGFAFAAFGNINALDIYRHLAANEIAVAKVVTLAEQEVTTGQFRAEGRDASDPAAILGQIEAIRAQTDLPVGIAYFPYCKEPGGAAPERTGAAPRDPRCARPIGTITAPLVGDQLPDFVARMYVQWGETIVWLLSIIATAGLLALGAPFWFDLFNKIAAVAGGQLTRIKAQAAAATAAAADQVPPVPPRAAITDGVRLGDTPPIEDLVDAFFVAGGRPERAFMSPDPGGGRLGPASGEAALLGPG